jgi:hypothetical protein
MYNDSKTIVAADAADISVITNITLLQLVVLVVLGDDVALFAFAL